MLRLKRYSSLKQQTNSLVFSQVYHNGRILTEQSKTLSWPSPFSFLAKSFQISSASQQAMWCIIWAIYSDQLLHLYDWYLNSTKTWSFVSWQRMLKYCLTNVTNRNSYLRFLHNDEVWTLLSSAVYLLFANRTRKLLIWLFKVGLLSPKLTIILAGPK